MTFHTDVCEKHMYSKNGKQIVKPIKKMIINGEVICPRCELERDQEKVQQQEQRKFDEVTILEKYRMLQHDSILDDETIKRATFDSYKVEAQEETKNKQLMINTFHRLIKGEKITPVLQGKAGTGKSHLAHAILQALNEYYKPDAEALMEMSTEERANAKLGASCLFVGVEAMTRLIRQTFSDKESPYTEQYFVEQLSKVDFLVLDDLGAETGAINTEKSASDFIHRVLYAISTARQNKVNILTTNLTGKQLLTMYDSKLISRLIRNPEYIVFKDTKDKRLQSMPF